LVLKTRKIGRGIQREIALKANLLFGQNIPLCRKSDYNEDIILKKTGFPLEAS